MGRITVEDAVKDLLNDYSVNGKRTHGDAKRRISLHLEPFFRGKRLLSIGSSEAVAYVAARQTKGAKNATINRELALLKRMFSLAVRHRKLYSKPTIDMLAENNVRRGFSSRSSLQLSRLTSLNSSDRRWSSHI